MSHVGWGGEETPLVEEVFQAKRKAQEVCRSGRGGWKACGASCVHFGQNELLKLRWPEELEVSCGRPGTFC